MMASASSEARDVLSSARLWDAALRGASCAFLAAVGLAALDGVALALTAGLDIGGAASFARLVLVGAGCLATPAAVAGAALALPLERLRDPLRPVLARRRILGWGLLGATLLLQLINVGVLVRLYELAHQMLTIGGVLCLFLAAWLVLPLPSAVPTRKARLVLGISQTLLCLILLLTAHDLLATYPRVRTVSLAQGGPISHGVALWRSRFDQDGDGWSAFGGADCDDTDPAIHPGAPEEPDDGLDSDCLAGDVTRADLPPPPLPPALATEPARGAVILTVDALRADRLDGRVQGAMPRARALAALGTLFPRTYAPAPWTAPSTYALLTGRYPSRVRWKRVALKDARRFEALGPREGPWLGNTYVLPIGDDSPTLAACLGRAGFRTAAVATTPFMLPESALLGGFDEVAKDTYLRLNLALAGKVDGHAIATALSWLERLGPEERFLLWVHLPDPHHPYLAPGATPEERYDGELAGTDIAIGGLVDGLAKLGRAESTILLLTGDHGEEFGEHGGAYHGASLFEEVIRVPMALVGPGIPAGRTDATPVSLTDVAPTLADLLGQECTELRQGADGRSLIPRLATPAPAPGSLPPRPIFAERIRDAWATALILGDRKLIRDHEAATLLSFDLAADPAEHSLLPAPPEPLLRALSAHLAGMRRRR